MKTPLFRRFAYSAFIIIFIVAAPLIILYTMGYRYNFSRGRVQKTGILKITTIPSGAQIYLNGQPYTQSKTPVNIQYVLPGDYEIKLAKAGYFDWQKKLTVAENGTTFAEKIILFKQTLPQQLSATGTANFLISPDKNMAALDDGQNGLRLLDINSGLMGEISGGSIGTIAELNGASQIKLLAFSPSGRYLLGTAIKSGQVNYFLADTILKNANWLANKNYSIVRFDQNSDNLYGLDKTGLEQINLTTGQPKLALKAADWEDLYTSGQTIYYIQNKILSQETLNGQANQPIKNIDCFTCHLEVIKSGKALIRDLSNNNLTVVDLSGQYKNITAQAKGFDWLNNNSLVFYNDFEIYILNLDQNQPELITRLSTPITSVIWQPQGRHLIFSSDGKISIIELDNRERRNVLDLTAAAAKFLAIDRIGSNLYYSLDKGGIFKLNIQ